mmetsp:Transcript_23342/g.64915  ORF Transcript_23342/g.64915 Transcript_23342/m.64915 type:complete len:246 (-) Transcript_23342:904-1641(-)
MVTTFDRVGMRQASVIFTAQMGRRARHCRSVKFGHAAIENRLVVFQCFSRRGFSVNCSVRQKLIDNKRNHQVIDHDNPKDMKGDKEQSNPLGPSGCFEANLAFSPIVHHEKIEEHVHPTDHIIEVVRPVFIVGKFGGENGIRELILWIPCDQASIQGHAKVGKEIHHQKQEQNNRSRCWKNFGPNISQHLKTRNCREQSNKPQHSSHHNHSNTEHAAKVVRHNTCGNSDCTACMTYIRLSLNSFG